MAFPPRLISKSRRVARLVALSALGLCSCEIFTDVPLGNNRPHLVTAGQSIEKKFFYPDSLVCTLAVEDLNDEKLFVSACYTDSGDTSCSVPSSWNGSCRWLDEELGVKQAVLMLESGRLGCFFGHLHIADLERAEVKVPFSFQSIFFDPLNKFPLNTTVWACDTGFISLDPDSQALKFCFESNQDTASASTGIRSLFRISGNFSASVRFQLPLNIYKGFTASFFLAPSPGSWKRTGLFFAGLPKQHIRLTWSSIDMQTESWELPYQAQVAGKLSISRKKDSVECSFIPSDLQWTMKPNTFLFPADSAVYIHLRMNVDDRLHTRYCLWSDMEVTKGNIGF